MARRFPAMGGSSASHSTPIAPRSTLRPPIYNPFDKFGAQEFDAWIGDITGQLRRALGQEPPRTASQTQATDPGVSMSDEEVGEDSFAEIKARRAAKGKQRATYEELDEDELDDKEVELSILQSGSGSDEEDVEEEQDSYGWKHTNNASGHSEEEVSSDELSESDDEGPQALGDPDAPIEISDSDNDEEEEEGAAGPSEGDEEVDEEVYEDYEPEVSAETYRPLVDEEAEEDEEEEDEEDEHEEEDASDEGPIEIDDDEDGEFPPRAPSEEKTPPPVDIPDPWEGPSTYAEDFYSGGDVLEGATDAHVLPSETNEVVDVDEELEEPFLPVEADERDLPSVQLADKWEGPRTYAEDFYAGGDFPPDVAYLRTPSHLTPAGTPQAQKDEVAEFLTPGVLTPQSPSTDADVIEVQDDDVGAPPAEDVPTFSMPPESDDEGRRVEHSAAAHEPGQEDSSMGDLYDDLGDEPLPEAAEMVPPTPIPPVTDPNAAILDLHERESGPLQVSPRGDIDWNNPPAFPASHQTTSHEGVEPGNFIFSEALEEGTSRVKSHTKPEPVVHEISDDEEEADLSGPIPLGTSDLDIPIDATYDDDEAADDEFQLPEGMSDTWNAELAKIFGTEETTTAAGAATEVVDFQDELSFEEFESQFTNQDAPDSAHDTTIIADEPLEPVVDGDRDFGSLPITPSGGESRAEAEHDPDASLGGFLDVLAAAEQLDPEVDGPVDKDEIRALTSGGSTEQSTEAVGVDILAADGSASAEPSTAQVDVPEAVPSSNASEPAPSTDVKVDTADPHDVNEMPKHREAVKATSPAPLEDMPRVVEISEEVTEVIIERGQVEELSSVEPQDVRSRAVSVVSDGVEVATYRGETPAGTDYSIVEEASDEEETFRARSIVSDGVEVWTHHGETPPAAADFDIVEPRTEGRRTEEPESTHKVREVSITVESVRSLSPNEFVTMDVAGEAAPSAVPDAGGSGTTEEKTEQSELAIEDTTTPADVRKDSGISLDDIDERKREEAALSSEAAGDGATVEVQVAAQESEAPESTPTIQVDVHSAHGELADPPTPVSPTTRMLQPGIPMPVSADPTVPDPASVHGSPAGSPRSASPGPAPQHVLSAVPPGLMAKLSQPLSLSGLFTPFSEASSGSVSPVLDDFVPMPEEAKGPSTSIVEDDGGRGEDVEDEAESPTVAPLAESVAAVHTEDHDPDLDADGDIDPDYVEGDAGPTAAAKEAAKELPDSAPKDPEPTETAASASGPADVETADSPAPEQEAKATEKELKVDDAQVEEPKVTDSPSVAIAGVLSAPSVEGPVEPSLSKDDAVEEAQQRDTVLEAPNATALDTDAIANVPAPSTDDAAAVESPTAVPAVPPTPTRKRKRATPEPTMAARRLTRSRSKNEETVVPPRRSAKSLGKQKAIPEISEEEEPSEGESVKASKKPPSSASISASRAVSRASSIASTVPSEFTVHTPSSPMVPSIEATSLSVAFRREGFLRHHHGAAPPPPPPPPPPPRSAPAVQPAAQDADSVAAPSKEPVPSDSASQPDTTVEPVPPPTHETSGTSPVTRSHCRFRKISIPIDEYRHRAHFVVPGCSLSNTELMEEYDIREHGEPDIEDVRRLRSDLGAINIRGFALLTGILHQLVGKSLDKDLFYLPTPGEKIRFRKTATARKGRISNVDNISSRNGLSLTKKAVNAVKRSPATTAESASMAGSPARSRISIGSSLTNKSISEDEESEEERKPPPPKRRRRTAKTTSVDPAPAGVRQGSAGKEDGPTQLVAGNENSETATARPPATRRSRRLAVDSQAYKPEEESDGDQESEEEAGKVKGRRKRAVPRGIKRSRDASGPSVQITKKRKTTALSNDDGEKVENNRRRRKASATPSNGANKADQTPSQTNGDGVEV